MSCQSEIRSRITQQIVESLEKGVVPWRRPWVDDVNAGAPANVISKRRYSGINPMLLHLASLQRGFQSRFWGTYKQWQTLGCNVMQRPADVPSGSWGVRIVFWKPVVVKGKNDEEKQRTFPLLREYTVFNAEQVSGPNAEKYRVHEGSTVASLEYPRAEEVIKATGADIRHGGNKAAYYRLPLDYITCPHREQFDTVAAYFETLFHEIAHWSEHPLSWVGCYALGELRAEIGASYLASELGIPTSLTNHSAYLDFWVKAMKADNNVIFKISSAASKAVDFILSFSQGQAAEEPDQEMVTA